MRPFAIFISVFCLLASANVQAQFGRKATVSAFVGTMLTGGDHLSSGGQSQDIFGGYHPGIVVGGALFYNITKLAAVGVRARYVNVSKTDYTVNQLTVGLDGKFNFLPSDKKLSPYLVAEANVSFVGVSQSSNDKVTYPASSYGSPDGNPKYAPVTQINYAYPTTTVSFVPMVGYAAGAGLDIRIKEAIGAFVQVDYCNTFAKNQKTIKEYFPNNTYNFHYVLVSVGLKFNLFKSTSLY